MKSHQLGAANELRAAAYFLEEGYNVFWPAVQQSMVDFVIEKDGFYQRVQVKSATWNRQRSNTYLRIAIKTSAKSPYQSDSFDLLVGVHRNTLWLIPWEEVHERGSLLLGKEGSPEWSQEGFDADRFKVNIEEKRYE